MTVADYADADPAIVKSGRVKKAVANAVEKEGNLRWRIDISILVEITVLLGFAWKGDPSASLDAFQ